MILYGTVQYRSYSTAVHPIILYRTHVRTVVLLYITCMIVMILEAGGDLHFGWSRLLLTMFFCPIPACIVPAPEPILLMKRCGGT